MDLQCVKLALPYPHHKINTTSLLTKKMQNVGLGEG